MDIIILKKVRYLFTIILAAMVISAIVTIVRTDFSDKEPERKGSIDIAETNPKEDFVECDAEWDQADQEYYEDRKSMVSIVDPQEQLSREDFLPIKAHFMKAEEIGRFLSENNLSCDHVTVVDGSAGMEDKNPCFDIVMEEYPSIKIHVVYYMITEEFSFQIMSI